MIKFSDLGIAPIVVDTVREVVQHPKTLRMIDITPRVAPREEYPMVRKHILTSGDRVLLAADIAEEEERERALSAAARTHRWR